MKILFEKMRCKRRDERGFSLVEVAIVLVIIGLLAGGGVSLLNTLSKRKGRTETLDTLAAAKEALVSYCAIQGRLPWADTDGDGLENAGAVIGFLPYSVIAVTPRDPFRRQVAYAVNPLLAVDRPTGCKALRSPLAGAPLVVDNDGSATAGAMALVLVSAGPMDADGDGNAFDRVTAGTFLGDNTSGNPNWLRSPPLNTFDDLTLYLGGSELFRLSCGDPVLSVNNGGGTPVYVYDPDNLTDLAVIAAGAIHSQRIFAGTTIQLRNAPSGGGALVASTPVTPITFSGNGQNIQIP